MEINTVEEMKDCYIVNGIIFVPKDKYNRDCRKVITWIANNS